MPVPDPGIPAVAFTGRPFAASVLGLCNDRDELRSVGAAARAASSGYDWNAALDGVVETYLDAVPQWRAAAQSGVRRLKQPNAT